MLVHAPHPPPTHALITRHARDGVLGRSGPLLFSKGVRPTPFASPRSQWPRRWAQRGFRHHTVPITVVLGKTATSTEAVRQHSVSPQSLSSWKGRDTMIPTDQKWALWRLVGVHPKDDRFCPRTERAAGASASPFRSPRKNVACAKDAVDLGAAEWRGQNR